MEIKEGLPYYDNYTEAANDGARTGVSVAATLAVPVLICAAAFAIAVAAENAYHGIKTLFRKKEEKKLAAPEKTAAPTPTPIKS